MSRSEGAMRVMQSSFFFSNFIDMAHNRIVFWFHQGISDEDIQRLLDESGIPADALFYRGGWVVTPD